MNELNKFLEFNSTKKKIKKMKTQIQTQKKQKKNKEFKTLYYC